MELEDHAYTSATSNKGSPVDFTYKMSSKEIEAFVKLRVSNKSLFSGRRNTSMQAWRAILKHMGLQHKMTHSQASKKWENMKKKYKELKNPPDGVKVFPETWPHFTLMDDAIRGRLEGNAPVLKVFPNDNRDFLPISKPKKRKVSMVIASPAAFVAGGPEIEVSLNGEEDGDAEMVQEGSQGIDCIMQEVESERNMMDSERQVMEKERQVMESERLVLQRERAVLDREVAALDRGRALLERERATMEREKAIVERDRDAVCRERLALERERERLERLFALKEKTEDSSKVKDAPVTDRKERFLYLFEKLIESL